jgi:hypothetical protein
MTILDLSHINSVYYKYTDVTLLRGMYNQVHGAIPTVSASESWSCWHHGSRL